MTGLSLALLGPMQITLDGRPVVGFAYNKARILLAYLAVETDRPHHRDTLAALLWPEVPDEAARHNLRQALTNLREAIGDASATPQFLLITRNTLQLNPVSDYELDVSSFSALLAACEMHTHRHLERCRSCAARMGQAIALYRGDFLTELSVSDSAPFEEWQLRQRERLHQRALDMLTHLANYYERRGENERARHYVQRQIELDPWREEAHRQLMRLLAQSGQRSAALAQYEACRRTLAHDLGVQPEAETTALYERLRAHEKTIENEGAREAYIQNSSMLHSQFSIPRHNFPAQTTPLIGRERELTEIGALLESPACRLITIVGPGGIGKTRLALAAAAEQAETFTHGAAFVPLQGIVSALFLAPAILSALDVPLQGNRDPRDHVLAYLRDKELLLILDNFEQLLAADQSENQAAASLLSAIVAGASSVTLLVTSRERLNLHAEWVFDIRGLQLPASDRTAHGEDYGAVALFLQRARQAQAQLTFDKLENCAVVRICRLVEGMPLGIELAATWVRALSCIAIADRIEQSLDFLTTSARDVPERHRSLEAVFDHSWRLMSPEEQSVFRKLSVFRGGISREGAEQVAAAELPALAALVDKSLLRRNAADRYDMHELLRQYASEKLEQAGEMERTRTRHLMFFLALAETAEPWLTSGERDGWLEDLDAEHDNLRTALAWSQTATTDPELALRLAGSLQWFWQLRDYVSEGRRWLVSALARLEAPVPSSAHAKALKALGTLAWNQGDYAAASPLLEESVAIWRIAGDKQGLAHTLLVIGWLLHFQGNDTAVEAPVMEAAELFQEQGEIWGLAFALNTLGMAARDLGQYGAAHDLLEKSVALFRESKDPWGLSMPLNNLGLSATAQGHYEAAGAFFSESLALRQRSRNFWHVGNSLINMARLAGAMGRQERAARLWGAAETLYDSIGVPSIYNQAIATARSQLAEATSAAAWAEGRAMTLEQAIVYALEGSQVKLVASSGAASSP